MQTASKVYVPQDDSRLLIEAMGQTGLVTHRRVLDVCTGSGVVAIAAAELGAAQVTAVDICPHAVRYSQRNARNAGAQVNVCKGRWERAFGYAPFDVVVANPPYVPTPSGAETRPVATGPATAWDGGVDGRVVLDPLCEAASRLLAAGGSMLVVQSEFANARRSLASLRATGMNADIIAVERIPFGPVLLQRAGWLERTGRIRHGCREEQLVVIRADKP